MSIPPEDTKVLNLYYLLIKFKIYKAKVDKAGRVNAFIIRDGDLAYLSQLWTQEAEKNH